MTSSRHFIICLATLVALAAPPAFASQCSPQGLANQAESLAYEIGAQERKLRRYIEDETDPQATQNLTGAADAMNAAAGALNGTDAGSYLNNMNGVLRSLTAVGWKLGVATAWGKKPEYAKAFSDSESALSFVLLFRQTVFDCYTKPYLSAG